MGTEATDEDLAQMRAAAARTREAAERATADLRRQRAAIESEHRADPSYGMAERERQRERGGDVRRIGPCQW